MLIGLTGRIASGKGVVAEYLKSKGFEYATISMIIRREASKLKMVSDEHITRNHLQNLGNLGRNLGGAGAWVRLIAQEVDFKKDYVVDGIRNPGEIEELRGMNGFCLISVDAPLEVRYNRILSRGKESDAKTWEEFLKMDERDFGVGEPPYGQQVEKCMGLVDHILVNDVDLEFFYRKIDKLYEQLVN